MRQAETGSLRSAPVALLDDAPPWPVLSPVAAAGVVAAWALALALVSVFAHPTPLYFVETDLVGEYLPAARELARGVLDVSHYSFKGPGYPLLLAYWAMPFQGDVALAARVLSPLAAGCAAWLAFALARGAAGGAVATFTLIAMLAAPAMVRYAIEAGTDAPALALMLGSTWFLLRGHGARPAPPGHAGSISPGEARAASLVDTASALLAGLLAGYAILTRGNAVFLVPCAAVVLLLRPRRAQPLAAYALGVAVPLAAWYSLAARAGGLPPDRNYLNVAWELYGFGVPWDRFEADAGARFHSMLDVLRYDPPRAALHMARNLALHRWLDAYQLIAPWLGVVALPGLALLARERRARAWLWHAFAAALVLAPVFYNARFGLYLLPVYLAAAGCSIAWLAGRARQAASAPWALRVASPALGLALVLGSAASAIRETREHLADAPHEVRVAGAALVRMGLSGEGILARKPHVAFFAGMRQVAFPTDPPLWRLPTVARASGAGYLFFSGIEQVMRPDYAVLADSGLALPGFEQVLWERLDEERFFAAYRLSEAHVDSAAFARAYHAALMRYEQRRPGSAEAQVFVAAQLIAIGAPGEALSRLDRLRLAGARDGVIERFRATALLETGDLAGAADACAEAIRLSPATAWDYGRVGEIRVRQRRVPEARAAFEKAVEIEGANLHYLEMLGRSQIALRDYAGAATTFERGVRLAPADVATRRHAIGAWQLAGNEVRARQLFAEGVSAGVSAAALAGAR